MKKIVLLIILILIGVQSYASEYEKKGGSAVNNDSLVIIWSSGDKEVATKMVFMYALNAKKRNWWKSVTLIIWGPSSKLLSQDEELKTKIAEMKNEGIILEACKACADQYGVSDSIAKLGIEVKYMGMPLTEYIKRGDHILTF